MYYPPLRSNEIYHWGIEKGKERKNHKYYNRILTGTKNGQNVYRYFYDKAEWDAYNANKRQQAPAVQPQTQLPSSDITGKPSFLSRLIFGRWGSELIEKGKELLSNIFNDELEIEHDTNPLPTVNDVKPEDATPPKVTNTTEVIEKRKEAADKNGGARTYKDDGHKYLAKIPMGDGTFRYFYDKESLEGYYKDTDDPLYKEFGVRDDINTTEEDRRNINERYHEAYNIFSVEECKKHAEYENNCYSCTTAAELRRRGYDVDAINDGNGESWDVITSMYKDPTTKTYDCKEGSNTEKVNGIVKDMLNEGEGARGNICIYWSGGSGHSLMWEVTNGEVTIIDNQTDAVYKGNNIRAFFKNVDINRSNNSMKVTPEGYWDIYEQDPNSKPFYDAFNVNPVQWIRTDNCELNTKNIKKYVRKDY